MAPSSQHVNLSIQECILQLRGMRVLLDQDLAELYDVPIKRLNEQVRRNHDRFPDDFMFQLSANEAARLRSQNATLKPGRGAHRKYLPYAFTEQGVAMLSSVLHTRRAISVNIEIMRAFVRMRHLLDTNAQFARKIEELEKKYDGQFAVVFRALRQLMEPPKKSPKRIGF